MLLQLGIVVAHNDVCFHYLFYISSDGVFDEDSIFVPDEQVLVKAVVYLSLKKHPQKITLEKYG